MAEQILAALEQLFLALSDRTRLRLLSLMAGGEVSVGFLADALGESQPKISRHLAYLRNAGVVSTRRDGKWIYYGIARLEERAAEEALVVALRAISGKTIASESLKLPAPLPQPRHSIAGRDDISVEPHMMNDEWEPVEMEVFLL